MGIPQGQRLEIAVLQPQAADRFYICVYTFPGYCKNESAKRYCRVQAIV